MTGPTQHPMQADPSIPSIAPILRPGGVTNGTCFISGRAALGCLLDNMSRPFRRAFIPIFTCNTVLEPFRRRGIPVMRYRVNKQLTPEIPDFITEDDLLLATNYFGLTGSDIAQLCATHSGPVIVDAATALYAAAPAGVPVFYSPRKFCHAPHGGLAVSPEALTTLPPQQGQLPVYPARLSPALRIFRQERELRHREELLSSAGRAKLAQFDWAADEAQRRRHYAILHAALKDINRLHLPDEAPCGPMCYPLLTGIPNLRDELADAGLRLPLYWTEVIHRTTAIDAENILARHILPLPLGPHLHEETTHHIIASILGTA